MRTSWILVLTLVACQPEEGPKQTTPTAGVTPPTGTPSGSTTSTGPTTPTGTPSTTTGTAAGTPAGTPGGTATPNDLDADGWSPAAGDCDDTDPSIHPEQIEVFGDGVDHDCNGDPDTTPFAFGGFGWTAPRPPRIAPLPGGYLVLAIADQVDLGTPHDHAGVALGFPTTAGWGAVPTEQEIWQGQAAPLPLRNALDVVHNSASATFVATTYSFPGVTDYVATRRVAWPISNPPFSDAAVWTSVPLSGLTTTLGQSVDVVLDAREYTWTASCGSDSVMVVVGQYVIRQDPEAVHLYPGLTGGPPPIDSGICFWDGLPTGTPPTGELVVCDPDTDCVTYTVDPAAQGFVASTTQRWTGTRLEHADARDDWFILVGSGADGVRLEGPIGRIDAFAGEEVLSADAHWLDTDGDLVMDRVYVAAVVEDPAAPGTRRVMIEHGDPSQPLARVDLDFADPARPGLDPAGVSLHVDKDRMVVAVSATASTGSSDAVGWVFMGW